MFRVLNTANINERLFVVANLMGDNSSIFADSSGTLTALTTEATVWMCRTREEADAALKAADIPVTPTQDFEVLTAWLAYNLINSYEELVKNNDA